MFRKTMTVILFSLILLLSLAACGGAAEAPMPTLVEVTPLATDTLIPPAAELTLTDPKTIEPTITKMTPEPTATCSPAE